MSEDENGSNGSRLACDFKSDQMRVGEGLRSFLLMGEEFSFRDCKGQLKPLFVIRN
jgi:hypothetical protein